ncbi:MAG: hypothetical protein ACK452_13195, partial [Bacteroidota bacterium]
AGIRVFRDGAVSGDAPTAMAFYTTSTGSTSNSERMRITKDGRLGIGTNTPSAALHVVGGARFSSLVGPGTVIADASGNLSVAAGGTITGSGTNNYVARWTSSNSLYKVNILAGGTTTALQVNQAGTGVGQFVYVSNSTNSGYSFQARNDGLGNAGEFNVVNSSSGSNAINATSNGQGATIY